IRDIGIVIRKGKEVIQDYFEALIKSSDSMWGNLKHELSGTRLDFIFQKRPLGLGNAIYEAGRFINELPFIMIIPDQFVFSRVPATRQLLNAARGNFQAVWSTLVAVPEEELHFFPGARRFELTNRIGKIWEVTGIRDGSGHSKEESLLGFGRSFFPAGALDFFTDEFLNPVTGEVDLLPSFDALIKEYRNYAVLLEGKAMDFGTWEGYERFSKTINQQGIEETNHAR
ncbi:hypothetical protein KA005_38750, partial [bacterium]|nr:hypothetical protein [bacterium]